MGSKKSNFVEQYIDKIIIAAAGLLAAIILFVFVISVPKIDGKSPKDIDESISRKSEQLQQKLNGEPNEKIKYESKQKEFLALLGDSIDGEVNDRIFFPLPGQKSDPGRKEFTYRVPQVGPIAKPSLAVVKMAAFVPTEELSTTVTYNDAGKEIQDLDLVTIESSIDVKSLYSKFKESFAAKSFAPEKKKEQYAKPVFAKVQLQRKTQQSDGNWSEWTDVPQTKICYLKKNLEIPATPSEFAIEMALVQFAKGEFRDQVLQPDVYCNAIPSDPWISPTYYKKREVKLAKAEEERKKLESEADKSRRLSERTTPARETRTAPTTRGPEMGPGGGGGRGGRDAGPSRSSSRNTRQVQQPVRRTQTPVERTKPERPDAAQKNPTTVLDNSEETEYTTIKLRPETNLNDLDKLVFWAHDDTTKPGEKYQYRIRLGVFNPIAGKNCFAEDQKEYQNQVMLWSDFADVNEIVEIPQRLYFFATNYIETTNDKIVEVMVARYMLGNWASKKYKVKNGEAIGKADEQADARLVNAGGGSDVIDLSTGAVMVDTRKVASASKTGEYYEMIYNYDGSKLERTPIKEKNWPSKVSQVYKEINNSLEADPVTLLTWEQAASDTARRSPVGQPDNGLQQPTRFGPEGGEAPTMPMPGPGMP
jgi:hypothetical protein